MFGSTDYFHYLCNITNGILKYRYSLRLHILLKFKLKRTIMIREFNTDLAAIAVMNSQSELMRKECFALDADNPKRIQMEELWNILLANIKTASLEYIKKYPNDTVVKTHQLIIECDEDYDEVFERKYGNYVTRVLFEWFEEEFKGKMTVEGEGQPEAIYVQVHESEILEVKKYFEGIKEVLSVEVTNMLEGEYSDPDLFSYSFRSAQYVEHYKLEVPMPFEKELHEILINVTVDISDFDCRIYNNGKLIADWTTRDISMSPESAFDLAKQIQLAYTNPEELVNSLKK